MIACCNKHYFKSCHPTITNDLLTLIFHEKLKRLNNNLTLISTPCFKVGSSAIHSFAFQERKFYLILFGKLRNNLQCFKHFADYHINSENIKLYIHIYDPGKSKI